MFGNFSTAVGFDNDSTLIIKDATIRGTGNAVSGCNTTPGTPTIIIENSSLISDQNGFQLADKGQATLTNVNIDASTCIFASGYEGGSHIIIDGGKYNAGSYVVKMQNGANVEIKDGEFNFNDINNFATFNKTGAGTITITGGTFNGVNYLEFFTNGQVINGGLVSINGTTVTIAK